MKTTFAKSPHRSPAYTKFATPLVLDPPRHCGLPAIHLGPGKHLIGTSHDCSVRVRADDVQPRHAMIVVSEHRTIVKALDPRTWVNEGPVSEMALRPGDRLSLGPLTFRVRAASPDELADFVIASDHSFDDSSFNTEEAIKLPVQSTFSAEAVDSAQPVVAVAPVAIAASPVVESITTGTRDSVASVSCELPKVTDNNVELVVNQPSDLSSLKPSLAQNAPSSNVSVNRKIHPIEVSLVQSNSADTLDVRLDEIEQTLADLQQSSATQSASTDDYVLRADALAAERRQLIVRQEELQRRADELTRQSQQLHERIARVAEREAEVERSQARLALDHEQLSAAAEITRKELDDEYARHMTLWQEWDSAYRRTSGELNGQLQSMEQRRTALMAEADRLAGERSELQRLQAEHERDRRMHAAERVQLTTDRAALQTLRAEFDTERQQQLVAVQEREARVAIERRAISITQEELVALRQQLERDRTEFLAERASEAARREQELREHVALREQLDLDHTSIQSERSELLELRREVYAKRAALDSERHAFESQQSVVTADRVELRRLQERLQQLEADLARLQNTQNATRSTSPQCEPDNSTLETSSLDWFAEPYKSIHLPPPVPDDGTSQEFCAPSTNASVATAPSEGEILPLSTATLVTFDDGQQSFADSAFDQKASLAYPVPQVTAPAAAIHRFWEDNTLYDTSVSSHIQHQPPTTFVSSSNLMMTASAAAPSVAMPLEAMPLGNPGFPSASSSPFDEPSSEESVAIWSRSLDTGTPNTAIEVETSTSSGIAAVEHFPTIDDTLAEVNRQFGMPLPAHENAVATAEDVVSLPNWWRASETATLPSAEDHSRFLDSKSEASAISIDNAADGSDARHTSRAGEPATAQSESADPLVNLRAQLARMFDLPSQSSLEAGHNNVEETAPSGESSVSDHEHSELALVQTVDHPSNGTTGEMTSGAEPTAISTFAPTLSTTLNELASTALISEPSAVSSSEPELESQSDDSVETYMARLLSRARGCAEVSASEVKSLTAAASATAHQRNISNGESPVRETEFDPADRSHLTAEPKHKQDRQAVREDLQSFRQVAHQSARSALARHSTKVLLSAVVAKSILLGISTLATITFLGAPLVGLQTHVWKGMGCSLATLLSATEVYRSWQQLRSWKSIGESHRKGIPSVVTNSANASTTTASDKTGEIAS